MNVILQIKKPTPEKLKDQTSIAQIKNYAL